MAECFASHAQSLASIPSATENHPSAHTSNPSALEVEAGTQKFKSQPQLRRELEASLGYRRKGGNKHDL